MLHGEYTTSYLNYAVPLWLFAGCALLWVESKVYEQAGMPREQHVARLLGWLNIVLGIALFVCNWAFKKWLWS